ncbi:hypothetical protein [Nostoc sp. JL23]|uniref:hypothetical protein n=1 Tax=Nostoc sp. JL23 TaxID=2815394 RepID=UPI001DDD3D27|nr:hypothetical protein [Nostoc sp. JL23]MBN3875238.1 hypothetical protein [Nostoc sp. JL23]
MFYRWVFARSWAGLNGGYIIYHRQYWLPFFKSDEIAAQVMVSVQWTVEDGEAYGNWSKPLDKYARKHLLPTINSSCSMVLPYSRIIK